MRGTPPAPHPAPAATAYGYGTSVAGRCAGGRTGARHRRHAPAGLVQAVFGKAGTRLFHRATSQPLSRPNRASTSRPCQVPVTRAVAGPP